MAPRGGDSESGEDHDPPSPQPAISSASVGTQPQASNLSTSPASASSSLGSPSPSSASASSSLGNPSPSSALASSSLGKPKHSLSNLLGPILGAVLGALLLLAVALLLYRRHRRRQARAEQHRREREMRLAHHIDPLVAAPDLRLALEVPAPENAHTHWDKAAAVRGFGSLWPAGEYVARDSFSSTSGTSTDPLASPSSPTTLRYSYTPPGPVTSSVRESLTVAGGIDAQRPSPARPQVPSLAVADADADADAPMTPMDTLMRELDYSAHVLPPVSAERAFASTSTAPPPEYIE